MKDSKTNRVVQENELRSRRNKEKERKAENIFTTQTKVEKNKNNEKKSEIKWDNERKRNLEV